MLRNSTFALEFHFEFVHGDCKSRVNEDLGSKSKLHSIVILFILGIVNVNTGKLEHLVAPVVEVPFSFCGTV